MLVLNSISPFYPALDLSPLHGESSLLSETSWKHCHRHIQRCVDSQLQLQEAIEELLIMWGGCGGDGWEVGGGGEGNWVLHEYH